MKGNPVAWRTLEGRASSNREVTSTCFRKYFSKEQGSVSEGGLLTQAMKLDATTTGLTTGVESIPEVDFGWFAGLPLKVWLGYQN